MRACMDGFLTGEWTKLGGHVARLVNTSTVARYCHLAEAIFGSRQVKEGDLIGLSGDTGAEWPEPGGLTGPHLHWEIKIGGVAVNPSEYISMKKTNLHFENAPNEAQRCRIAASNFDIVKSVWPFPNIPGKTCISRHWIGGDHEEQKYIERGVTGAQELFQRMLPLYQQFPGLYWEPWNEPDTSTLAKCRMLCIFAVEYARLMHGNGYKIAGLATGTGRPEDNPDSTSAQKTAALGPAYMVMDLITNHNYYCPPQILPNDLYHALRYRKIKADLESAGFNPTVDWASTESGIDRGIIVARGGGFKNIPISQPEYLPYIQQHDDELCKDSYMRGCTVYTLNPNPMWATFDYGGWLEDQLYTLAEPRQNDLLVWAESIVIPFNPQAALGQYIDAKGWNSQSQEMSHDGIPYQWGRYKVNGIYYRTLLAWQSGRVVEVYTRKN